MISMKSVMCRLHIVIAIWLVLIVSLAAQVKTTTTSAEGPASKEVTVERGEVAYISGNDLIVKMEDGQMRHFTNIPESSRVIVGGQQLGIHDLKPGMKLERTITVTTIPKTITTVETVTGKVWHASPPSSVILMLENGETQSFKIPKDQKFMVDGEEKDAFGLKKGMKISATRIIEVPETVVQHEKLVTGKMPPPPPPVPTNAPILIVLTAPQPAPSQAPAEPTQLPASGSLMPLLGLLGLLLTGSSFCLRLARRQ